MSRCTRPRCTVCGCRIARQCVNHDVCCQPICRLIWQAVEATPVWPIQSNYVWAEVEA